MRFTSMSVALAALAASVLPAHAAGPFDGSWYVDAPPAEQYSDTNPKSGGCEAVRIFFTVSDNRVSGSLQPRTYGEGFEASDGGPGAAPLTGTVQTDGTVAAEWKTRQFTGKLAGDQAQLKWSGVCGARVATGRRAG